MRYEIRYVLRGLRWYARLLQEPKIAEPVDESELPLAKRRIVPICKAAAHPASVRQGVAWMPPNAVDVKFNIGHADLQHRIEIFHGPDGMDPIA